MFVYRTFIYPADVCEDQSSRFLLLFLLLIKVLEKTVELCGHPDLSRLGDAWVGTHLDRPASLASWCPFI